MVCASKNFILNKIFVKSRKTAKWGRFQLAPRNETHSSSSAKYKNYWIIIVRGCGDAEAERSSGPVDLDNSAT